MNEFGSSAAPGGTGGGGGNELLKGLAEQKLKSFSIGTMGKRGLSKKEQEELRKKQEEEAVGKVRSRKRIRSHQGTITSLPSLLLLGVPRVRLNVRGEQPQQGVQNMDKSGYL